MSDKKEDNIAKIDVCPLGKILFVSLNMPQNLLQEVENAKTPPRFFRSLERDHHTIYSYKDKIGITMPYLLISNLNLLRNLHPSHAQLSFPYSAYILLFSLYKNTVLTILIFYEQIICNSHDLYSTTYEISWDIPWLGNKPHFSFGF